MIKIENREELMNALMEERPSIVFEKLRRENTLSQWLPELEQLIGVAQNPEYHPEGDVWTHTMMVVDEAAKLRDEAKNPEVLMLAALTHDFGKAVTTEVMKGKICSHEHETEGLPLAEKFMSRFEIKEDIKKHVLNLVEFHMRPNMLARQNSREKSTNRLFAKVLVPEDLILLAKADSLGRGKVESYAEIEKYLRGRLERYYEKLKEA